MSKRKKGKKTAKKSVKIIKRIFAVIIAVILLLCLLLGSAAAICEFLPGKEASPEQMTNPYITEKTLVSAHRSGGELAPENTMMAFKNCIENKDFNVDIFEFDLHITKDGQLILLHDGTLDRTTNSIEEFGEEGVLPATKTYDELMKLNFGENFQAPDGSYPYRGLRGKDIPEELHPLLLDELLQYLTENGDFSYIIEIKDAGENGFKAADELHRILVKYDLIEKVVFGTFNGDVTDYVDKTYPDMLRSSGIKEVLLFYFAAAFNIELNDEFYQFEALQIPANQFYIPRLGTARVVNYAHRHNIAVQYWTINDAEDVKKLSSIGADCIMSDDPSMAYDVINGK